MNGSLSPFVRAAGLSLILILVLSWFQSSSAQIYDANTLLISTYWKGKDARNPFLRVKKDSIATFDENNYYTSDFEGYIQDVADILARRLGYHYVKFRLIKEYGEQLPNSTNWNGIVGEVIRITDHSHIGLAPLTITRARAKVVDFSSTFMQFQLGILQYYQPDGGENGDGDDNNGDGNDEDKVDEKEDGQSLFLEPFTRWLWALIAGTGLILLFAIFFMEKYASLRFQGSSSKNEKLLHHFCSRVFGTPRSTGARILQISTWIWLILIFCSYTANFAANRFVDLIQDHLPKPPAELRIQSVQDLLKHEDVQFGILKSGSTYAFFNGSSDPRYQEMLEKMEANGTLMTSEKEGIDAVENGNGSFVFIGEMPTLRFATLNKPCKLAVAPSPFGPKRGFGVATRNGSRLSERVNQAILELKENGMLEDIETKWFSDRSQCPDPKNDEDNNDWDDLQLNRREPLDLDTMAGLFYFLVGAIILFFIITIIEINLIAKFRIDKTLHLK